MPEKLYTGQQLLAMMPRTVRDLLFAEMLRQHNRTRKLNEKLMVMSYTSYGGFINSALTWDHTRQGHSFWNLLADYNYGSVEKFHIPPQLQSQLKIEATMPISW